MVIFSDERLCEIVLKSVNMENYVKGEVREVEEPPIFSLGDKDVLMRVSAGTKIRNVMGYAMKKIKEPDTKLLCWSASGKGVTKAVTCAEIMKRKIKGLHQVTEIRKRRMEEYWEPKVEGLERLKVNRDIPAISILLSKESLDKDRPGYQAPGSFDEFWKDIAQKDKSRSSQSYKRKPGPRNVLLEGANGAQGDGPRRKTNANNENRKRKFESDRGDRGKHGGRQNSAKANSNKNNSNDRSNSGKGTPKIEPGMDRKVNKDGAQSATQPSVTMETDS